MFVFYYNFLVDAITWNILHAGESRKLDDNGLILTPEINVDPWIGIAVR